MSSIRDGTELPIHDQTASLNLVYKMLRDDLDF